MASSSIRITTQVVQFGTGSDDPYSNLHLSAEIDDREANEGGLNGGDTDFAPGDTAVFLVYKSSTITLKSPVASAGSVSYDGTTTVRKTEFVTFANEPEGNLDVPAASLGTREWIGNDLGTVTLKDETTLVLDSIPEGIYAGVLKITYDATATVGRLDSGPFASAHPEMTEFEIVVVVVGEAAAPE